MSDIVGRTRKALGFSPGKPTDPHNVESELTPWDYGRSIPPPTESEQDLVRYVERSFKDASEERLLLEREWLTCYAFRNGNQWFFWSNNENRFMPLQDPKDTHRNYVKHNYIRPLLEKVLVRATLTQPDAGVHPLTDSPIDVSAAAEARDIIAHYDNLFDRVTQTQDWLDCALVLSTSFLKIMWDPKKSASTAYMPRTPDEMRISGGRPIIVPDAEIGDLVEVVVPSFEVYPAPTARSWPECPWLIHAKYHPLSYFQEQFGERGYRVKPDTQSTSSGGGWWEWRLDQITGNQRKGKDTRKEACLYEMWEKLTPRYPKGRLIRVAGGQLMTEPTDIDWPYEKNDSFPFVPMAYQPSYGTLWPSNATSDLLSPQRGINKTLSRLQDRIDTDTPLVFCPEGCEITPDDFTSSRIYRKVWFRGNAPRYEAPPPVNVEAYLGFVDSYKRQMEDSVGMHEPSDGGVPPGVTSGTAIEFLQDSDRTQLHRATSGIEKAQCARAEWELAICREKFSEPRLIAVSQDSQDKALGNARAFRALQQGQCRVVVVPGSAMPKSAAARKQDWLDTFKLLAQNPAVAPLLKLVWDEIGLGRSDIQVDRLDDVIAEMMKIQQASQPDPAALAAQQAQSEQQQLQMKQQFAEALAAIKLHSDLMLQQAKNQGDIQVATVKATHEEAARDHQTDAVIQEQGHQAALGVMTAEHAASLPKPASVSLSSPMDPAARASAEESAGLKSDPKWQPPTPGAGGPPPKKGP